ncbi:MAG: type IV toxin-antitoxin system AbiEi family antitoxin domain-containing protein [Planctomycetes bacterium]|nr:type IV toxin-antitoxin system AbiEi family antitoxin domain-containing protein [Planctomycetota bacterium]
MSIPTPTARYGIEAPNRAILEQLHRALSGPFTPEQATRTLGRPRAETRALLAYLASRGWLSRIRRGLYATVPLGASAPSQWREDTWLVAAKLFSPCFIGGWSAAEHWGLTEQIFRDVVVLTGARIRRRAVTIQGTTYRLKYCPTSHRFGTRPVWRGQTRVEVSDPTRTLVDLLDYPALGGGMRHVGEIAANYFAGEHRDDALLLDYVRRLGNRTVYKRLGYLAEMLALDSPRIAEACARSKSSGVSLFDPSGPRSGKILKRWNLKVNVTISRIGETS